MSYNQQRVEMEEDPWVTCPTSQPSVNRAASVCGALIISNRDEQEGEKYLMQNNIPGICFLQILCNYLGIMYIQCEMVRDQVVV